MNTVFRSTVIARTSAPPLLRGGVSRADQENATLPQPGATGEVRRVSQRTSDLRGCALFKVAIRLLKRAAAPPRRRGREEASQCFRQFGLFHAKLGLCVFLLAATACKSGPELARFYPVPDFSLTDQSDRNITLTDLKGQVWVADFIFTNCAGACPMMTDKMRKLQDALPAEVRMVSITVDPSRDTPKALAAYAAERGATPDRWLFLTGDKQALHDLCIKGFKLPLDETGGTAAEPIAHSTRFVLVDQQGDIRGYYDATDEEALNQLAGDAKSLL